MPLTDAEKLANQKATIQCLYAEVDALRARLAVVQAVLRRTRTAAQIQVDLRNADDDGKAEMMRMPD